MEVKVSLIFLSFLALGDCASLKNLNVSEAVEVVQSSAEWVDDYFSILSPQVLHPDTKLKLFLRSGISRPDTEIKIDLLSNDESIGTLYQENNEQKLNGLVKTTENIHHHQNYDSDNNYNLNIHYRHQDKCASYKIPLKTVKNQKLIHIQTDKPAYKQGEEIKFFVAFMNSNSTPYNPESVSVKLEDNRGNVVKLENAPVVRGIYENTYKISKHAKPGTRTISVTVNDQTIEKNIEIDEYVLPLVSLKIKPNSKKIGKKDKLKITLEAEYSFGKPARGNATVTIGIYESVSKEVSLTHGSYGSVSFDIAKIFPQLIFMESGVIFIAANFTDNLTGKTYRKYDKIMVSDEIDSSISIHKLTKLKAGKEYKILVKLSGDQVNFKQAQLEVVYLPSKKVELRQATIRNNVALMIWDIPMGVESMNLTAKFQGYVSKTIVVDDCLNPDENIIRLELLNKRIKTDESIKVNVRSTSHLSQINWAIVGRFGLVQARTQLCKSTPCLIQIEPHHQMIPESTLVVYYMDEIVIYDFLKLKFENSHGENLLKISTEQTTCYNPSENILLNILTKPNSLVRLWGYDRSLEDYYHTTGSGLLDFIADFENDLNDISDPQNLKTKGLANKFMVIGDGILHTFNFKGMKDCEDPLPNRIFKASSMHTFNSPPVINYLSSQPRTYETLNFVKKNHVENENRVSMIDLPEFDIPSFIEPANSFFELDGASLIPALEAPKIRTEFFEVLMFDAFEVKESGFIFYQSKLPDTITTWKVFGLSMNEELGAAFSAPLEICTLQNVFIKLVIPPSIKVGEVLKVDVIVFKYDNQRGWVDFDVTMHSKDQTGEDQLEFMEVDKCSISLDESDKKTEKIKVKGHSGTTTSFYIRAKKSNEIKIRVDARNVNGFADSIEKVLKVEHPGITIYDNKKFIADFEESNKEEFKHEIKVDESMIHDSHKYVIGLSCAAVPIPDERKPLDIIGKLQRPQGCPEQELAELGYAIFGLLYHKHTNQLTSTFEKKVMRIINDDVQHMLDEQDEEFGYYKSFASEGGRIWMAAYCIKLISNLELIAPVDPKVIESKKLAFMYLERMRSEVKFERLNVINQHDLRGNIEKGIPMVAFIAIAYMENNNLASEYPESLRQNLDYLMNIYKEDSSPYAKAITAYAFSLTEILDEVAVDILEKLEEHAETKGKMKMYPYGSDSATIETAAYALLAYAKLGKCSEALPLERFLLNNQDFYGYGPSTHATILSTQALYEMAKINCTEVTSDFSAVISSDLIEIDGKVLKGDSCAEKRVFVIDNPRSNFKFSVEKTSGKGRVFVDFMHQYTKKVEEFSNGFDLTVKVKEQTDDKAKFEVCGKFLGEDEVTEIGQTLIEVHLPSGFVYNQEANITNEKLKQVDSLLDGTLIVLYFETFNTDEICVDIEALQTNEVLSEQMSKVMIYDYYNSDISPSVNRLAVNYYKIERECNQIDLTTTETPEDDEYIESGDDDSYEDDI